MADNYDVTEQSSSCLPPDVPGIKTEVEKVNEYADYSKRMESFKRSANVSQERKRELVLAGFYLHADGSVRCYHCRGLFKNWDRRDNPMQVHAKMYPHCQHMLVVKGHIYIDKVTKGELVEEGASQNVAEHSIPESEFLEEPACRSCIEMGFSKEKVLKAVHIFISKYKHRGYKGADLCKIVFDLEDDPDYDISDIVQSDREAPENPTPEN